MYCPEEIIKKFIENNTNINTTALCLDIDRKTVRKWVKRSKSSYGRYNITKIIYKSKKRKNTTYKLSPLLERRIVRIREDIRCDQDKIAHIFHKETNIKISPKTVYNILNRRSPELRQSKKRYTRPRFQNGKHMWPVNTFEPGFLQLDVKHITPELSGLHYTIYEYGFIDIYSRYKNVWIQATLDQESTIVSLRGILKMVPFKVKFIQTDNGWEFGKKFHEECIKQGIEHYYIPKSSPNENAVIERSFRTDQDEFFYVLKKRPKDINDLNIQYQKYLEWYNNKRPHFGLNLKTPVEYLKEYYGWGTCTYLIRGIV